MVGTGFFFITTHYLKALQFHCNCLLKSLNHGEWSVYIENWKREILYFQECIAYQIIVDLFTNKRKINKISTSQVNRASTSCQQNTYCNIQLFFLLTACWQFVEAITTINKGIGSVFSTNQQNQHTFSFNFKQRVLYKDCLENSTYGNRTDLANVCINFLKE